MKFTLKTVILIALLAFYIVIILSNFSNFEGFTSSDSLTIHNNSVITGASTDVSSSPTTTSKAHTTTFKEPLKDFASLFSKNTSRGQSDSLSSNFILATNKSSNGPTTTSISAQALNDKMKNK